MDKIKHFFGQQHTSIKMPERLKQIVGLLNREELITLVKDLKHLTPATKDH